MAIQAGHGVRLWSNRNLSERTTISAGVNDTLAFQVDGVDYSITLDPGVYESSHHRFSSSLVEMINNKLTAINAPVIARHGGIHDDNPRTVLVLEHKEITNHVISNVTGTAGAEVGLTSPANFYATEPNRLNSNLQALGGSINVRAVIKNGITDLTGRVNARRSSQASTASRVTVRKL